MLMREIARVHVDMARELYAGQIQEDGGDIPLAGGERDDFDDVLGGGMIAG